MGTKVHQETEMGNGIGDVLTEMECIPDIFLRLRSRRQAAIDVVTASIRRIDNSIDEI